MVPFYLSGGDPRKDYNFIYAVGYNPINFGFSSSVWNNILNTIFNSSISAYVSLLAEKVTLPAKKLNIDQILLGNIGFPYIKGYDLGNIQVQYLEDALGLVEWFHSIWQNSIRPVGVKQSLNLIAGGTAAGSGMLFNELGKYSGFITYAPTQRIFVPTKSYYDKATKFEVAPDVPLTADVYPAVFPLNISRTPGDKTGANLSHVNVDFLRIPLLGNQTARAYKSSGLKDLNAESAGSLNIFH